MKTKSVAIILMVILLTLILGACTPTEIAKPALTVQGLVDKVYTLDDLNVLPQVSVDYTNKDNETTTYTGVAFSAILFDLKLGSDPVSVQMVAIDEYVGELTFEELKSCSECIIAVLEDGTLRSVLPGFSSKVNVRDLVTLKLQ